MKTPKPMAGSAPQTLLRSEKVMKLLHALEEEVGNECKALGSQLKLLLVTVVTDDRTSAVALGSCSCAYCALQAAFASANLCGNLPQQAVRDFLASHQHGPH